MKGERGPGHQDETNRKYKNTIKIFNLKLILTVLFRSKLQKATDVDIQRVKEIRK